MASGSMPVMLAMSRFAELVRAGLPEDLAERWIHLAEPDGYRLFAAGAGDETVGALGGEPLLPGSVEWPHWEGHGPLSFVASLDCAGLPGVGLPKDGKLLFFYFDPQAHNFSSYVNTDDPETCAGARVLYVPDGTEGEPRRTPEPLSPYRHVPLRQVTGMDPVRLMDSEVWKPLGLTPDDLDGVKHFEYVLFDEDQGEAGHQVGGRPQHIQHPVALEIAGSVVGNLDDDERLWDEARRWMLLAQIAGDEGAGMEWGDGGRLYWMIMCEDLEARRFDRVRLVWQSH
ncbi:MULTISPECIES: YwqG family protein [unclassified Spirillospora]|uniref:YwqG family protein n=1 Tax=unclassified Spirillospora TaxID=2642701 RepID=UPI003715CA41